MTDEMKYKFCFGTGQKVEMTPVRLLPTSHARVAGGQAFRPNQSMSVLPANQCGG
jgi:hypothetical protein